MAEIQANDVLLGRGPCCYRNPGNVAFRNLVQAHVASYSKSAPRLEKRKVVQKLISKAQEQGCRFLVRAKNSDIWCEAHPYVIRSKVSHSLRDARISTHGKFIEKTTQLPASSRIDDRRKSKSNGKQTIFPLILNPSSSKVSTTERNDFLSIDRRYNEDLARQHPRDYNIRGNERSAIYYPEAHEKGLNSITVANIVSLFSPRLRLEFDRDCYPAANLGMTDWKFEKACYLSKSGENMDRTFSLNHQLGSFNVHYPHTYTHSALNFICDLAKKSISCSNFLAAEVQDAVSLGATNIWCKGPSHC